MKQDPDTSTKGTFYPAATKCYRDPAQASCFLFGNSGSGVVRTFKGQEIEQYAFTGPLSMSKSCDNILIYDNKITYGSENPGIFTDAHCYLPWIAASYGMKLADGYRSSPSCAQTRGDKANINQSKCMGRDTKTLDIKECDFRGYLRNGCRLFSQEGYAYNIYICKVDIHSKSIMNNISISGAFLSHSFFRTKAETT